MSIWGRAEVAGRREERREGRREGRRGGSMSEGRLELLTCVS